MLTGFPCQWVSLQSTHHSITHHTGQIGVLTVGLLSPAPSRITEDVDIRRPYRQTAHLHILTAQVIEAVVILCTKLRRSNIETLVQQDRVERRRHRHRLREHRDIAHIGSPMQGLAPPEELLDAQARNGGTLVEHQLGFLFQGETTTQIDGTLMGRQLRIFVWQLLGTSSYAHA